MKIVRRGTSIDFDFDSYADCWKSYRRANFIAFLWFVGWPFVVWLELMFKFFPPEKMFLAVDLMWAIGSFVMYMVTKYWPCPRCKQPFNPFKWSLSKRCVNCGLEKGSVE